MQTGFRTIDGVSVRYAASDGAHEQSILLTSPWPESLLAFTPIWSSLARHARRFAIDLPGFGQSERRNDLLAPAAMGEFLARLIEECDLGAPHIVAPDIGTPAALFAAAAHPDLLSSAVVGAGVAAALLRLGRYSAMHPRGLINAAIKTSAAAVPDEIRADYLESYDGERFAESMRYVRSYTEELPRLAGLLSEIDTPVLIINGRDDQMIPLANAKFLHERLPSSRLAIIDAGHFVWEEQPAEYAALIIDWISRSSTPVVVAHAQNQAEAELIQGLLRTADVPSYVRRAPGFDVPDFLAAGPRDVLVPPAAERIARETLRPQP